MPQSEINVPKIDAPVVVLIGPTAVGKTELALTLAKRFEAEIIGADSMQIYRYMDIGTAKPTEEERAQAPHHLVDFVDPDEDYQAARYGADGFETCQGIVRRGRLPLVVGGTGLYIRALVEGLFDVEAAPDHIRSQLQSRLAAEGRAPLFEELQKVDPQAARRIHLNDTQRLLRALEVYQATGIPWSQHLAAQKKVRRLTRVLKIGLSCDRKELYRRINIRSQNMLKMGLLKEVQGLLDMGYAGSLKSMQSIGYRHMVNVIKGDWTLDQAVELLARDTRRYAKRQFTWFGRDPEVRWLPPQQEADISSLIHDFINEKQMD